MLGLLCHRWTEIVMSLPCMSDAYCIKRGLKSLLDMHQMDDAILSDCSLPKASRRCLSVEEPFVASHLVNTVHWPRHSALPAVLQGSGPGSRNPVVRAFSGAL
jgi:hypothetical protein